MAYYSVERARISDQVFPDKSRARCSAPSTLRGPTSKYCLLLYIPPGLSLGLMLFACSSSYGVLFGRKSADLRPGLPGQKPSEMFRAFDFKRSNIEVLLAVIHPSRTVFGVNAIRLQ